VHYGWAPKVELADDGSPRLVSSDEPVWPQTKSWRLPHDFRPAVQPIDRITHLLGKVLGDREPELAAGAARGAPSLVFARVLKSAREAGLEARTLLAQGPDGMLRGIEVKPVLARRHEKKGTHIYVRLGGYSLDTRRGLTKIPRVRKEDGLHFDVDTLAKKAEPHGAPGSLGFMTVVDAGPVMSAAFRLAPEDQPLTLLLP
jgi:hypothetical protein